MQDEIFREPPDHNDPFCTYVWKESELFQMQWIYSIEWSKDGGPKMWIFSYTCWQRANPGVPFEMVDSLPCHIPMSDSILSALARHAGEEIYRRSLVVGGLTRVPENYLGQAQEASKKGYSLELLRKMSQREAATTATE